MINQLLNLKSSTIRGAVYLAVLLPAVMNVLYDFTKESITIHYVEKVAVFMALVIAATELCLRIRKRRDRVVFANTQLQLYGVMEKNFGFSVTELIQRSSKIDILCDTLKSFSDDESRIKAINKKIDDGASVRILLLDHESSTILKALCNARSVNKGVIYTEDNMKSEVLDSLKRFERFLGGAKMNGGGGVIRRYAHYPTCAIYRFDDFYMVCPYTFGRGGSSPAFLLSRSELNDGFCDGLDQGFDELWNASSAPSMSAHRGPVN